MFASPEGRADVGKSGRIRATSRTRRRTELTTAPDIRFDTPPKDGEPVATGALGLLRMPRVVLFGEGQRHAVGQVAAAFVPRQSSPWCFRSVAWRARSRSTSRSWL